MPHIQESMENYYGLDQVLFYIKAMFGLRILRLRLGAKRVSAFFFFFFLLSAVNADFFNREQCIRALFMDPQISLFINFFIKNGSHDTIHTFKN